MNKFQKAQMYVDFLKGEGYVPTLDSDGDVTFKKEGGSYLIMVNEDDNEFFQVVYPNFWKIESDAERARVLVASGAATSQTKVAKVYIVKDNVWASVELFVGDPLAFKPVFNRCLSALQSSVKAFVTKMRE